MKNQHSKVAGFAASKFLLIVLLTWCASGKAQQLQWVNAIGGASIDRSFSTVIDGSGNVFVTGEFRDTADFDPSLDTAILISSGISDIFLAKYDKEGNYLWAFNIEGSDFQEVAISLDKSDQPVITGVFQDSVDFDPSTGNSTLYSNGYRDIFLAKYSSAGTHLWSVSIGGVGAEAGTSVTVDNAGDIIVAGIYSSTTDFDPSANTVNLLPYSVATIFLAKYSTTGHLAWAKAIPGGSFVSRPNSVVTDASGDIYLTGYFEGGSGHFDPSGSSASIPNNGGEEAFLAKYDGNGNYLWAISIGDDDSDIGYSVVVDGGGDVLVSGIFDGVVDFDPSSGFANLNSSFGRTFLAKYTSNGNYIWAVNTGSTSFAGSNIVVDGEGNSLFTGKSGSNDFMVKFDDAGNFVWGFSMKAGISEVLLDNAGNILLSGTVGNNVDFDPTIDSTFLTTKGLDVFLAKYNSAAVKIEGYNTSINWMAPPVENGIPPQKSCTKIDVWPVGRPLEAAIRCVCGTSIQSVYPPNEYHYTILRGSCTNPTPAPNRFASIMGLQNSLQSQVIVDTFSFTVSCPAITLALATSRADSSGTDGMLIVHNIERGLAPYDFLLTNASGDTFSVPNANQALFTGLDTGYYHILVTDSFGCSAVDSFNLYIDTSVCSGMNTFTTNKPTAICHGDSMLLTGAYRRVSGFYFDTIPNFNGCDSIIAYELNVKRSDTVELTFTTSDSTLAGVFDSTYTNSKGCDSLVISTTFFIGESCTNDSLTLNAITCDSSLVGTTIVTYLKDDGCDSVVTTITNLDTIAPSLTLHSFTTYLDFTGSASVSSTDLVLSSIDSCRLDSVWCSRTGFSSSTPNLANGTFTGGAAHVESVTGAGGATNYRSTLGTSCSDNWYPPGTFCDEGIAMHSPDSSYKSNIWSGATWHNNNPGISYGILVADLGMPQDLKSMSVFQMFSDGKTTHIRAFYHTDSSGVAPAHNDTGWVEFVPLTMVGPGTLSGSVVTNPLKVAFNPIKARYIKFFAFNDNSYGDPNFIELRSVKLFGVPLSCDFYCSDIGSNKVYVYAKDAAGNLSVDSTVVNVLDTIGICGQPCTNDSLTVNTVTCDSTQAGTSVSIFAKGDGCDSVVTIITTFDPGSTTPLPAQTICDGESITLFGISHTQAGTYSDTLANQNGCDSILTVQLIVNPSFRDTLSPAIVCDGESALVLGIFRSAAGWYVDSALTLQGCHSITWQELIVLPHASGTATASICQGDSILLGGAYRLGGGIFTDTLSGAAANGCDSILTTTLTVNPVDTTELTTTTGDSTQAGVFTQILGNRFGCDSVVITTVTYVPGPCAVLDSVTVNQTTCDSALAGTTVQTFAGSDGCDSIVTTITVYDPGSTTSLPAVQICEGDSAQVLGTYQSVAGTYSLTLQNQNGCDSVLTQALVINPVYSLTTTDSICPGDSLLVGGAFQTMAGVYTNVFAASNGCDSTVVTTLFVKDSADCAIDTSTQGCLSIVSDISWMQSTVVDPSNFSGYWPGSPGLPAPATFTQPVVLGQPYGYPSIQQIQNTDVIKTGHSVTYFRKEFILANANDLDVRLLITVDDQAEVFLNGQQAALISTFGRPNYKFPAHDVKFGSGVVSNGFMGGDSYDVTATAATVNGALQVGANEVIVAVRNLGKPSDIGGFSFRMDINCDDNGITEKSAEAWPDATAGLIAYPNPVVDVLALSTELAITSVRLYDLSGKLVYQQQHDAAREVDVNLGNLASGVYLLEVGEVGDQITTLKVVKK